MPEGVVYIMSEVTKSSKCENCGHIFEYALWLSSCPNCRSSNLQIVEGAPPEAKKKEVRLVSDAYVPDPTRPIPKTRLIHNDDLRETHFQEPEGGVKLIIDEESRGKPSSLVLHEVKLILDETSAPHESKLNIDEIELLIMEIEKEYRPDPNMPRTVQKPMTPEEIAKAAVKKRLQRMQEEHGDMESPVEEKPPVSFRRSGTRLAASEEGEVEENQEAPSLSFSRKSRLERPEIPAEEPPSKSFTRKTQRLDRVEETAPAPVKKSFLSRLTGKQDVPTEAPELAAKRKLEQQALHAVEFDKELAPNRNPSPTKTSTSRFSAPTETEDEVIESSTGKRELPTNEEKGKREIPIETPVVPEERTAVAPPVPSEPVAPAPRRRYNLPPVEEEILPPITADGKPVPPMSPNEEPPVVGLGKKPRLQPPTEAPVKKSLFKKKK